MEKSPDFLAALERDYRALEKKCEAAKAKLDANDFDDLFKAEAAYTRMHKKMQAARVAYLNAKNVGPRA